MTTACRLRSLVSAGCCALLLLCAPRVATAEPTETEKETARNLMRQGDAAFEAQSFAKALSLYQAAHEIMGVPSTGLALARAQERLGRWIEARETALAVARYPARSDEPPAFTGARTEARALAEQLAVRIPSLTIRVLPSLPAGAVRITIDGVPARSTDGPVHRVNPGAHRVTASAAEHGEAVGDVRLAEGEHRELSLTLARPGTADAAPGAAALRSSRERDASWSSIGRPLGFVALGLGFVGLAAGAVTGTMSAVQTADLKDRCPGDVCQPGAQDDIDRADTLGTISNVALVAGAVGIAAGIVLLATSGRASARNPPARAARSTTNARSRAPEVLLRTGDAFVSF